jgi:hypothetical protein
MRTYEPNDIRMMVEKAVRTGRMTRKQWAEMHGLSYTYLNHFMNGDCAPPPELLRHFKLRKAIIR